MNDGKKNGKKKGKSSRSSNEAETRTANPDWSSVRYGSCGDVWQSGRSDVEGTDPRLMLSGLHYEADDHEFRIGKLDERIRQLEKAIDEKKDEAEKLKPPVGWFAGALIMTALTGFSATGCGFVGPMLLTIPTLILWVRYLAELRHVRFRNSCESSDVKALEDELCDAREEREARKKKLVACRRKIRNLEDSVR